MGRTRLDGNETGRLEMERDDRTHDLESVSQVGRPAKCDGGVPTATEESMHRSTRDVSTHASSLPHARFIAHLALAPSLERFADRRAGCFHPEHASLGQATCSFPSYTTLILVIPCVGGRSLPHPSRSKGRDVRFKRISHRPFCSLLSEGVSSVETTVRKDVHGMDPRCLHPCSKPRPPGSS